MFKKFNVNSLFLRTVELEWTDGRKAKGWFPKYSNTHIQNKIT